MSKSTLAPWQQLILLGGVVFAAYKVGEEVGLGINPFITTCIYGGVAFLIALIWATHYIKNTRQRYWHNWLLGVGAAFGWTNWVLLTWSYYAGTVCPLNCPSTTPWLASCLYGALLFTTALIFGIKLYRQR
jgi:hypothetical protein